LKEEEIIMEIMRRLVQEEEGQGMVEYALIIALIAVVAAVGLTALGPKIDAMFDAIALKLNIAA
jgi:pilus assembly protein Flp/PilA